MLMANRIREGTVVNREIDFVKENCTFLFYFLSLDLSFEVHNVYTAINNDGSIFCFLSVSGGFALTFAEHELVENKGSGLTSVKG